MRRAKYRNRKPKESRLAHRANKGEKNELPAWLVRSAVYQRVPKRMRCRVDTAILLRPPETPTCEAIAAKFKLADYGVSLAALKSYVGRLEEFVRPSITSQLMASVLGCLPESYRRQLLAGSQVMLVSRVIAALTAKGENTKLPIPDLVKLSSVLSAVAGRPSKLAAAKAAARNKKRTADAEAPAGELDPVKMAQAVRTLYGLDWAQRDEAESEPHDPECTHKS